jgi:hypothetical protein
MVNQTSIPLGSKFTPIRKSDFGCPILAGFARVGFLTFPWRRRVTEANSRPFAAAAQTPPPAPTHSALRENA